MLNAHIHRGPPLLKTKYVRASAEPFMTKALRKAIMFRTRLRNRKIEERTPENWNAFKKQRNKCVKTLRQAKCDYCGNLDEKSITDKREYWKTVKPLFSEKVQTILVVNGNVFCHHPCCKWNPYLK